MNNSRLLRSIAVFVVLLMPFGFFLFFEINKQDPPQPLEVYGKVPYFKLINQQGDTVTSDDLKGYTYVTEFFFTHCPGVCPKLTGILSRVQKAYIRDQRIRLVSITVDPDRDSSSVLKEYSNKYGADPFKWNFLTGDKKDLYKLGKEGFKLPISSERNGEEEFTHSDRIVLVDASGRIRGYFGVISDSTQIDSLFNSIERVMIEKPK